MTITQKDTKEIQKIIGPLLGKKAWDVSLGVGSFITFNFGKALPKNPNQKNSIGEWHLWIQFCDWQLKKTEEEIINSESQRTEIRQEIGRLEGLKITSINVIPNTAKTEVEFEDGYSLLLNPLMSTEENEDLWWLFIPDGKVLILNTDEWSLSNADSPR